jgi:hypothetical protein
MAQRAQIRKIFPVVSFGGAAIAAGESFPGSPFRPDPKQIQGILHDQAEGQKLIIIEGPVKIKYKPPNISEA